MRNSTNRQLDLQFFRVLEFEDVDSFRVTGSTEEQGVCGEAERVNADTTSISSSEFVQKLTV